MTELQKLRELHERREGLINQRSRYVKPGLKLTRHQRRLRDRLMRSIERLDRQIYRLSSEADRG